MTVDPAQLSEAIVLWTGWGVSAGPLRDEARIVDAFGEEVALVLVPAIRSAEEDFYKSEAWLTIDDLEKVGDAAADRFRSVHPEIHDDAIRALAWCYTYDFK